MPPVDCAGRHVGAFETGERAMGLLPSVICGLVGCLERLIPRRVVLREVVKEEGWKSLMMPNRLLATPFLWRN